MNAISPQLQERRRERGEAALDIALAALRQVVSRADPRPGAAIEIASKALAQIEALVPEQAQRR